MLFSEVYGRYFSTVASVLGEAAAGALTAKRLTEIVSEKAFSESALTLLPAIKDEWRLLDSDLHTPIKKPPATPLTGLQKRWLASLLTDPRIALFDPDTEGLEDVRPLFRASDVICFDRSSDGDPFSDADYAANFRTVLKALKERRALALWRKSRRGNAVSGVISPYRLEYSGKDDKFRLICSDGRGGISVNLARISRCELTTDTFEVQGNALPQASSEVTFELTDMRNALERVMLHFCDCGKETRRIEDGRYLVTLRYEPQDVTEVLIRILSFGPMIRVVSPASFRKLIKERIVSQTKLQLK